MRVGPECIPAHFMPALVAYCSTDRLTLPPLRFSVCPKKADFEKKQFGALASFVCDWFETAVSEPGARHCSLSSL